MYSRRQLSSRSSDMDAEKSLSFVWIGPDQLHQAGDKVVFRAGVAEITLGIVSKTSITSHWATQSLLCWESCFNRTLEGFCHHLC